MSLPSTSVSQPDALDLLLHSKAVRNGLFFMGLLQGLLLLALAHSHLDRPWQALVLLLIVQPPLFIAMTVTRWRDARLWAGGAVMALVVLVMAGTVVWGMAHSPEQDSGVLLHLAIAMALWWMVALPWFQAYMTQGRWRVPYAQLFVLAWNNAQMLALAGLCVLLVWGVLSLWAGLFALVGVLAFAELFSQPWFQFALTGLISGLGLWLARTQQRPIQMMLQTLLGLGRLLLPLLAWVLVFFVLALVFTGVQGLWETQFAAVLLMVVLMLQIWVVNAVYQDGTAVQRPYARVVMWLVHASLLVMPVLASLACVAIGLRVQQYGWTVERVWAAAAAAVLWLYAVGYACAAVHSELKGAARPWLQWMAPINQAMSLLVLALLLALQTPVLDGQRIGAASQSERLRADPAAATLEHLTDLKFDHGPYGADALQALAKDPGFQETGPRGLLDQAMASSSRSELSTDGQDSGDGEMVDVAMAQERIPTPVGMARAPADWWEWLIGQAHEAHWARHCLFKDADCVLLAGDWDQDGQTDHLLCSLEEQSGQQCQLSARDTRAQWQNEGTVTWPYSYPLEVDAIVRDQLRIGRIGIERQRWPNWQLPHQDATGKASPLTGRLEDRRD